MLRSEKIGPLHAMDWGESLSLPGITVHCVPARYFSSRGVYDRRMTLWCGYVIQCQERLVYFAGDTGFGPHFSQIREKLGSPAHLPRLSLPFEAFLESSQPTGMRHTSAGIPALVGHWALNPCFPATKTLILLNITCRFLGYTFASV
ncbi:MAG: hypothetical protein LAQ69_13645 [Acidobacteriia bacterium]|nr:hypothetical protein [Terriglobia bacterium]